MNAATGDFGPKERITRMALKDDYLNWFPVSVTSNANSSTISETQHNTNASASSKVAWRIHKIEWYPDVNLSGVDGQSYELALCTRRNLSAIPNLTDMGVLGKYRMYEREGAAGYAFVNQPIIHDYLPPFVMAGANISMYWKGSADDSNWQSKTINARIGYTMVTIAGDVWQEIFQTWNFSN